MVAHAALTGAELHEPKGVAAAAAKTVYVADGAGSGDWDTLDYQTLPDGTVLNVQYSMVQGRTASSAQIPADSTIPQNTEGVELMTVSITPKLSTSKLLVEAIVCAVEQGNTDNYLTIALFLDSETDARAVSTIGANGGPAINNASLMYAMTSGGTSAKTFKIRLGTAAGGSWAWNSGYNGETYGDKLTSLIKVTEVKAS